MINPNLIMAEAKTARTPEKERTVDPQAKKTLGEFVTAGIAIVEFPERTTRQVADNGEYQPETHPAEVLIIPNHPA